MQEGIFRVPKLNLDLSQVLKCHTQAEGDLVEILVVLVGDSSLLSSVQQLDQFGDV